MLLLRESISSPVTLVEAAGDSKDLYIEGVFAQAEVKNRNGRIYPQRVMESAVKKYIKEFVETKRALGELSHPEGRPQVKPEFACHLITEMRVDGSNVYGKAKILNTPQGNVVRGLLEGGVQLGVSTRALGSVEVKEGTTYVKDDLQLMAVDVVSDPSAPDAFVNSIYEGKEWVFVDGHFVERDIEQVKESMKGNRAQLEEQALIQFQKFLTAISQ